MLLLTGPHIKPRLKNYTDLALMQALIRVVLRATVI